MNFNRKKLFSIVLSLVMLVGVILGASPQAAFAEEAELISAGKTQTLTILHINDVHGRVEYADAEEREPSIGYPRLKTKFDQMKKKNPNTLLLNAGDTLHGTVDINLSEGQAMVELMNMVGFDAMVPGNHDFNYGYERLLELKEMADFPILAANIVKDDGTKDFEGYIIKEMEGFKVGIFAITTEETKYKSHPDNTKGIEFADYIETSKKMVKALEEEKVDVIVALVHVGIDGESDVTSYDIADQVDGIDVIIDGHSHSTLEEGEMRNDVLIAQAGSYVHNIGKVEIKLEDGKIVDRKASLFTVEEAADLAGDKFIQAKINAIMKKNDIIKKEVIGETTVDLVGERDVVRRGESTLGNVITDAMLEATGADVALTNGGGIRASIEKGEITLGDAMRAFPFTNFLSTIEVKGKDILDAIEFGVDAYPDAAGKFPHVAGMTYVFNPEKPAGERVTQIMIAGEELVLDKTYELVTNDFVAIGGDGYTMFEGKKIVAEGALLSDVLVDYLKKEGAIAPAIEGRIVASKDGVVIEKPVEPEKPEEPSKPVEPRARYRVKSGDVLWRIAKAYNTTWEALADYNNLKNPHLIFPNQIILIN